MKLIKLSPESLEIVQKQTFSDLQPCSLLQDVNRFLNRVMAQPVPLSKSKRQPIQKWTALLNDELTEPDSPTLKRPLTIHYPSVLGLYLLVRAAGLGRIIMAGAHKFQLVINATMMVQWQQLTPTEQYFSLLDAWLTKGSADIIGEELEGRDHRVMGCSGVNFLRHSHFTEEPISSTGLEPLPSSLGAYNVALLKLFGLANVQWHGTNQLTHLQFTALGVTLFNAFQKSIDLHGLAIPKGCQDILYENDGMLRVVQQWRDNVKQLLHPTETKLHDSYMVNVSMYAYKCRRTLLVPVTVTLEKLARTVLNAFSFSSDRLYCFIYEDCYGDIYKIADPRLKSRYADYTDDTCLKDLYPAPGDQFKLHYDLNNPWEFILEVIDGMDEKLDAITVTERNGEPPREY